MPPAPSSDPPCSCADTKEFCVVLSIFSQPQLSLGISFLCTLPLVSAQHLDFSMVRSQVLHHLCLLGLLKEFPGESHCLPMSFLSGIPEYYVVVFVSENLLSLSSHQLFNSFGPGMRIYFSLFISQGSLLCCMYAFICFEGPGVCWHTTKTN